MNNRFDYVRYDELATSIQESFKCTVVDLESDINHYLTSPRAKALALTKLEEVYMWIGKAIRDDQLSRNGTAELQEERKDG